MGMEINRDSFEQHLDEKDKQLKKITENQEVINDEKNKRILRNSLTKDIIEKREKNQNTLKQSENMERPELIASKSGFQRMSDALVQARQKYELPSSMQLVEKLSPKMKQAVVNVIKNGDVNGELKSSTLHFLESLSKLIPLGTSLFIGLHKSNRLFSYSFLKSSILNLFNESGELIKKYEGYLQNSSHSHLLSSQLKDLINSENQTESLNIKLREILTGSLTPNVELISHQSLNPFKNSLRALTTSNAKDIKISEHQKLFTHLVDAQLLPASILNKETIARTTLENILNMLESFPLGKKFYLKYQYSIFTIY